MADATLTPDELHALTGYRSPSKQLAELHRQGFWRARRLPVSGAVLLERPHYIAVCSGTESKPGPQLRAPTLRAAR